MRPNVYDNNYRIMTRTVYPLGSKHMVYCLLAEGYSIMYVIFCRRDNEHVWPS